MCEIETALNNFEESFRRLSGTCKFQKTGSPNVFCSKLPVHWRSNKSLPTPFIVLILDPIQDGTKVTVTAGNEENSSADVKNNVTEANAQMARFSDLRFVGKSGRGKNFNLTITVHSTPVTQVAVVTGVIKVTVDGPRDSRNANKFIADYRKRPLPFDMIPSTSQLDFTHPSIKRSRFNRHGLLPNGAFGEPVSMSATTGATTGTLDMFMAAAAAQTHLNPMMLSMLSAVPIPHSLLPMAPNPAILASQFGLLPQFPPLSCAPPISCSASLMDPFHKPLNNTSSKQADPETHLKSCQEKDKEKSTSSLWRPYSTAK